MDEVNIATGQFVPSPNASVLSDSLQQPYLIYDVGMHNGDDTAFYLSQGFRVIAIEADPTLAKEGARRFRQEIRSARLVILNVGISDGSTSKKFWICETNTAWNSFDRSIASRDGAPHHFVEIQTVQFDNILKEFGVPVYLKIDIEGNDHLCLEALRHGARPAFVSAEDSGLDTHSKRPLILALMYDVGYRQFKLISQYDLWPLFERRRPKFIDRAINSAAYGRLRLPLLCKFAERMTYQKHLARLNSRESFPPGCSGPWGDGLPGRWVTLDEACQRYNSLYNSRAHRAKYEFWCDWHAKLST